MKGRACAAGALGILACVALLHLATATPASNERSAPLLLRSPSAVAAAGATGLPAYVRRYGLRQEARASGLAQGTPPSTNAMTKLRQRRQEEETEEEEEEEYCDSCAEQVGVWHACTKAILPVCMTWCVGQTIPYRTALFRWLPCVTAYFRTNSALFARERSPAGVSLAGVGGGRDRGAAGD